MGWTQTNTLVSQPVYKGLVIQCTLKINSEKKSYTNVTEYSG